MSRRRKRRKATVTPSSGSVFKDLGLPDLVLIPREHVNDVWNLCAEFIETALRGAEFSADQLREQASRGDAHLWFVWSDHLEAAAVTTMWETPDGRVCAILALGGEDMRRWFALRKIFEDWARKAGAKFVRIYGRRGWARMLPDYQVKRIVLDKELQT